MKTEKEMKKEGQGSYDEWLYQNDDVVLVRWQDNGIVDIASTNLGVGNIGTVRRWSEATKVHVDIAVRRYFWTITNTWVEWTKYMGGVAPMTLLPGMCPH